jgi:hypothetical protein
MPSMTKDSFLVRMHRAWCAFLRCERRSWQRIFGRG